MFKTCIFCKRPLGSNEVVETFPVGRRLAFDAARGRLWVVRIVQVGKSGPTNSRARAAGLSRPQPPPTTIRNRTTRCTSNSSWVTAQM